MQRLFIIAILLSFTAAHAEETSDWTIGARAGLGTPLGNYGAEVGWRFMPNVTWLAGVGKGVGDTVQVATQVRLDDASAGWGMSLASGLSWGAWSGLSLGESARSFSLFPFADADRDSWRLESDGLLFANIEVGLHYRTQSGPTFGAVVGVQRSVAGEVRCTSTGGQGCESPERKDKGYVAWPSVGLRMEF